VLKSAAAIVAGGIIAFTFADRLRSVLEAPFHKAAPESTLQTFAVAEQWGVLMRIGLFGGVILASPVVLYQIWAFVTPALTEREKKWAVPTVAALVFLFVSGVGFGYWSLPRGLEFLLGLLPDIQNDLRMADYYSFTLRFLFAFGLAFLYPVFLFAAAAVGVVTSAQLARGRRWAVLIMVIGAALITPTGDIFTLLVLSIPLYVMYEVTYWMVRLVLRK
jgi:sec-independent protein translocase protein TatC